MAGQGATVWRADAVPPAPPAVTWTPDPPAPPAVTYTFEPPTPSGGDEWILQPIASPDSPLPPPTEFFGPC